MVLKEASLCLVVLFASFLAKGQIVIEIGSGSADVECNKLVIIKCQTTVNAVFVNWQISYGDASSTGHVAQCITGTDCFVSNNFGQRYSYSYDSSTGVSNVTVNTTNLQDDSRSYICTGQPSLFLSVHELSPIEQVSVIEGPTENGVSLTVATQCIYPTHNIVIEWYYTIRNGSQYRDRDGPWKREFACQAGSNACIDSSKSKNITSSLNLTTTSNETLGEWRNYTVEISVGNDTLPREVPAGEHIIKYSGKLNETISKRPPTTDNNQSDKQTIGIVVGCVVAVLVFILIVIIVILVRRRMQQQNRDK